VPTGLFVPSPLAEKAAPRVDDAQEIYDVLAAVSLQHKGRETRLVIGLDIGRVIRVVEMPAELTARARAQLHAHEKARPWQVIRAEELYVFDVQAVEKQPDTPGADDPLFLYGVLRGPYPEGLRDGVSGVEGQLASRRGELLDGLNSGIQHAFHYERGSYGTRCIHASLPIDVGGGSVVLAFPLVPMGDDGSNEPVAAQVIYDVLGAMRADLGDDLAEHPVPVIDRAGFERELTNAGWTVKGDTAVHSGGKSRFASLFAPSKKQKLPREVKLDDYVMLVHEQLCRLPGWPEPARSSLHARIGVTMPRPRTPTPPIPVQGRAPTSPGVEVAPARTRTTPNVLPPMPPPPPPPRPRPPTNPGLPPPPFTPRTQRPSPPVPQKRKTGPRTVMPGLTAPTPREWIKELIADHTPPDRPRSRVVTPRATGTSFPEWVLDFIDVEFPDDDTK
jgi:hypothetical protein